jgi:hypothetical protein
MNATELELCARFLGEPYKVDRLIYKPIGAKDFIDEERIIRLGAVLTPGDLLLALLMRAAELGLYPEIWRAGDCWGCVFEHDFGGATDTSGPTPLAAMTAAVAKYMEAQ